MPSKSPRDVLHPIQVVVRRAGISADVLRAWERRYGAVTPTRTATGRRLYSDEDIERLRLIKEAMAGGRRIGDVATRTTTDLARLAAEDRQELRSESAPGSPQSTADFLTAALNAVRRADQSSLRGSLSRALLALGPARFMDEIGTPLMHRVGDMWERGELSPGHEHGASEVMRQLLAEILGMLQPGHSARTIVIATPSGQRHELGALLAAATAALSGWRVIYLGPDLPGADIARVVRDTDAAAVALSITAHDPRATTEVVALRESLGRELPILLGGQQAERVGSGVGRGVSPSDLESFRATLVSLATS